MKKTKEEICGDLTEWFNEKDGRAFLLLIRDGKAVRCHGAGDEAALEGVLSRAMMESASIREIALEAIKSVIEYAEECRKKNASMAKGAS